MPEYYKKNLNFNTHVMEEHFLMSSKIEKKYFKTAIKKLWRKSKEINISYPFLKKNQWLKKKMSKSCLQVEKIALIQYPNINLILEEGIAM